MKGPLAVVSFLASVPALILLVLVLLVGCSAGYSTTQTDGVGVWADDVVTYDNPVNGDTCYLHQPTSGWSCIAH